MARLPTAAIALLAFLPQALAADTDKTLVSWVTLTDRGLRSGSVLTLQDGDAFDGIVFAELSPDRWMAGSDFWRRSDKGRKDAAPVETGGDRLIQMAIVYRGDRITLYRNGEPYHAYPAKNIDLLSPESSFVVFGLRHVGGNGSFGGSIDDARIYDRALTADEIKSLRPNRGSSIKPYAWWDFNGDTLVDRAGRYPHGKLIGATLKDGRLILGRDAMAAAARTKATANALRRHGGPPRFTGPYVPDTPTWPEDPPDNWAIYHLAHPTFTLGSPFDPNPAFFYKGRYHLHYIYRNQTGFVFGHVSSRDMIRWTWHPTVLAPPHTGHGMFSGTGFMTLDGRAAAVYHGQGSNRNWIVYARDDAMDTWSEPEVMLPRDTNGELMTKEPYFDPDIWIMDGRYYGLNGRSSSLPPTIMKSDDLKAWTFIGELLHPDFDEAKLGVKKGEDISCPNVFKLGDKWVLVCISHRLGCRYFVGEFRNEQFLPEQHALMGGLSKRYFAPETLLTPDGRRVVWAWFFGGQAKGVQSLPVEMALPADGVMRYRPIRELESLRADAKRGENLAVAKNRPVVLKGIRGDHLELALEVRHPGDSGFGIDVLCDDAGRNGLRIRVDAAAGLLVAGTERAPFALKPGEPLALRIFVDGTLVEVFANERQYVMTDKPRKAGAKIDDRVALSATRDMTVDRITGWRMKSAYTPE